MSSHHEFSPSRLGVFSSCPFAYIMQKGWHCDGDDAQRGTNLHRAIYDDAEYSKCSDSDRRTIDFIRSEHVTPYVTAGLERYVELTVYVTLGDCILTSGTIDDLTISRDGKTASLKDWKFGSYEVAPAAENEQIWAYVCGVFQKFPDVEKVYALIVQPVYGAADYDKQAVFERNDMPTLLSKIDKIIKKARAATVKDANPQADNCRYCNKLVCPVYRTKMEQNFSLMGIDNSSISSEEREMTLEYADALLCAESEIKKIMSKKAQAAKDFILASGGSENFYIQQGKKSSSVNWQKLIEKYNISQADIDEATTVTQGDPYVKMRMRRKTKQVEG